jgi:hypothetical protein
MFLVVGPTFLVVGPTFLVVGPTFLVVGPTFLVVGPASVVVGPTSVASLTLSPHDHYGILIPSCGDIVDAGVDGDVSGGDDGVRRSIPLRQSRAPPLSLPFPCVSIGMRLEEGAPSRCARRKEP